MANEEAKVRVQLELAQLNEKITKLSAFIFSEKSSTVTEHMKYLMKTQLHAMQEYADCLIERLNCWDEPEHQISGEELRSADGELRAY